jgi:CheY-like chemotaxis protein/tetratricopeptide (TPR) repeat protein
MAPRILIAEENDRVAEALLALLGRHGMATERARDGVEALSRIVAAPPDVLLLDLKLPRLGGLELLDKLRRSPRTSTLPVVVGTGALRGERYAREAKQLGVAAYLERPYRPSDLLGALRRALESKCPAQATMDRHLLRAFMGRFSGRYLLKAQGGDRTLLFIDGLPVSLRPGFLHRDFGDFLLRKGIVSAEEYAYYDGKSGHRHEVLVRMGCLEFPELLQEKLSYLTAELVESIGHPPLSVEETPFAAPPGLQFITVNMPRLFYQGYHRHPRPETGRQLLAHYGGRFVALAKGYYLHINFLSLSPEEKLLLSRLDGSRTLTECLGDQEDPVPLLRTLHALGMIRFAESPLTAAQAEDFPRRLPFNAVEEEIAIADDEPMESFADLVEEGDKEVELPSVPLPSAAAEEEPASLARSVRRTHAELKGKNHYEIFGITAGKFTIGLLKERYFAVTRQYGPEVLMHLTGEAADMVEEILAAVATAYNTLSDVVKKERYDELLGSDKVGLGQKGDDRFQAQVQFQSGKVFIEMGEWESAEKALQDACNIDPNSGAYLAHLAWAIYRNPQNAHSRAMLEKAKRMLNRALTLERTASGFAFKGWMLLEGGQEALAELEFNKALKLDARQLLARQGLRAIREKREQEKKGLFRKMFR